MSMNPRDLDAMSLEALSKELKKLDEREKTQNLELTALKKYTDNIQEIRNAEEELQKTQRQLQDIEKRISSKILAERRQTITYTYRPGAKSEDSLEAAFGKQSLITERLGGSLSALQDLQDKQDINFLEEPIAQRLMTIIISDVDALQQSQGYIPKTSTPVPRKKASTSSAIDAAENDMYKLKIEIPPKLDGLSKALQKEIKPVLTSALKQEPKDIPPKKVMDFSTFSAHLQKSKSILENYKKLSTWYIIAHKDRKNQKKLLQALDDFEKSPQNKNETDIDKAIRRLGVYNALMRQIEKEKPDEYYQTEEDPRNSTLWQCINNEREALINFLVRHAQQSTDPVEAETRKIALKTDETAAKACEKFISDISNKKTKNTKETISLTYLNALIISNTSPSWAEKQRGKKQPSPDDYYTNYRR